MLMNAKQNLVNVQQTAPGVKQHVATGLGASNAPVIMAMNWNTVDVYAQVMLQLLTGVAAR